MNEQGCTLATLSVGDKGVIRSINVADAQIERLMTLGLVEGAEVEVAGAALGGDPIEFRLFGRSISLRVEQAQQFAVRLLASGS